jgi:hypothetical protein
MPLLLLKKTKKKPLETHGQKSKKKRRGVEEFYGHG